MRDVDRMLGWATVSAAASGPVGSLTIFWRCVKSDTPRC